MEEKFELKPSEEFMYDLYSNHAMKGLIVASVQEVDLEAPVTEETLRMNTYLARDAFDIAEAMVLERRKRKEK